jgi:hypothetical protein
MKRNKIRLYVLIAICASFFMLLPIASAHIVIVDVGHNNAAQWDDIEGMCGYADYQNVANYTVKGAILVFVDNEIVAGKMLNMKIRYVAGFRCSPVKTLEFPITEAEGDHTIVVYVLSMNSSTERTYEYNAEGKGEGVDVESENDREEDWLDCWGYAK